MTAGWVKITNYVWDESLCSPDRISLLVGKRWQNTGVYTDGLYSIGYPQDGSAGPWSVTATNQTFNPASTLAAAITTTTPSTITIAPTAEPIMLTAGVGYPGGKVGIGAVTGGPPGTPADKLTLTSPTPVFTSTTTSITVNVTGTLSTTYPANSTVVSVQAYFPQQLCMAPGGPGHFDSVWDWSHSWPWYLKQAGYQIDWFGKVANGFPWLRGDLYVPSVWGVPIFDRYMLILDDAGLGDQTGGTTNQALVTGRPDTGCTWSTSSSTIFDASITRCDLGSSVNTTGVSGNVGAPIVDGVSFTLVNAAGIPKTPGSGTGGTLTITPAYSGTDHRNHSEASYWATSGSPLAFDDNATGVGTLITPNSGVDTYCGTVGSPASPSSPPVADGFVNTAGFSNRQSMASGATSGYLTDYYNRRVTKYLNGADTVQPKPPFALVVPTRADHRQWTPALRHWSITPSGTPGLAIGALDHVIGTPGSGISTITWSSMPALTGRSTANGTFVMIGAEMCQVIGTTGTVNNPGTWTVTRDALSQLTFASVNGGNADVAGASPGLLQAAGVLPTWPSGTPVLMVSSSASADTGDDGNFNANPSGISPWWLAQTGGTMTWQACVQARRDRIIKAKTGMAVDELIYDIGQMCSTLFTNPTVILVVSDNGWLAGQHASAKGKINPYALAGVGPLYIYWPNASTASSYPYFQQRPNIVFVITDDDDSESLASFPILSAGVAAGRTENSTLCTTPDVTATICDLAGARPTLTLDGISVAPVASNAKPGHSYRTYAPFGLRPAQENGYPGFNGIQTLGQRYWQWNPFTVPATALQSGLTSCQVPGATLPDIFAAFLEGYDLTGAENVGHVADQWETSNAVADSGYTPTNAFTTAFLATIQSALAQSLAEVPTI